jgi:hypothetical protein
MKLFHLHASVRRRKNFIPTLTDTDQSRSLTSHEDKAAALKDFYTSQFGQPPPRGSTFNWTMLQPQRHDLT